MNIIIPMAGMGKRMRPHTLTTPKPLVPIAGKPIVHRIVEDIVCTTDQKVEEIAFIISPVFGKEAENNLIEVAKKFGAIGKIFYQEQPLGTAHAILCASECLKGNTFIAFADTLFKATFEIDTNKDAIIWTQKVEDPSAFGVVKMNPDGIITEFVEKPQEFVSDLAIIGVYYFKDGENLKNELQYLVDNNIKMKGEYQITDAMANMKSKGIRFYSDQVEEWLDCGNKDATLYTLERILEIKQNTESLISKSAVIENSTIIQPCFVGENVIIKNAIIGPYVALENGAIVENAIISQSIIGKESTVKNAVLNNSLLGNHVTCQSKSEELSLGDYSFKY
ncbi:MAG: nucleotidyltransferase [Chitinophagaceae bacterium]|nr:MAG: nucleotidyl transferase [Bacteroidetes bacterium OLB11]MCC6447125.1 nucleotidyltransferase [Chitinophagaceae bacterium]HMN32651.1 sugar phosphate nucleotidyltransferase [Chitinophagaceae bacterium]